MHLERLKPYSNTCFYHDLDMRHTKTLTGTKKNTRCPKPAQAQKKTSNHSMYPVVWCFLWGPCAGLVTLTSQNIERQQKQSRNKANISSNLLSLLLHLMLILAWGISIAAASWLQARSYMFGFQKQFNNEYSLQWICQQGSTRQDTGLQTGNVSNFVSDKHCFICW